MGLAWTAYAVGEWEDECGTLSTVCTDEFRCQFVDVGALYLYIYFE